MQIANGFVADAGQVGGTEALADVEDLDANDVSVLIDVYRDAVLDVDVVVDRDLADLDVQGIGLGTVLDLHASPLILGGLCLKTAEITRMRSRLVPIRHSEESVRNSTWPVVTPKWQDRRYWAPLRSEPCALTHETPDA